jgi:hypothetical protein
MVPVERRDIGHRAGAPAIARDVDDTLRYLMKQGSFGLRTAVIVLILSMAPAAAMAYIDPGNGAYMVQALFTLAAAALFYLRHPVRSLKAIGRWISARLKGRGSQAQGAASDSGKTEVLEDASEARTGSDQIIG